MAGGSSRARAAALLVAAGALTTLVAVVAAPGSWTAGYVSEAGGTGLPLATAYRCGLVLLGAGVAALGSAPALRRAAGPLVAAGVLAAVSGTVPCSAGCPLPPFQPTTAADLVHTAASIVGMAVLAGAMVLVATAPAAGVGLRRLAAGAAALTFPLAATVGASMLLVGRGPLVAIAERLLLTVALGWLVGTAALAAAVDRRSARRHDGDRGPGSS